MSSILERYIVFYISTPRRADGFIPAIVMSAANVRVEVYAAWPWKIIVLDTDCKSGFCFVKIFLLRDLMMLSG